MKKFLFLSAVSMLLLSGCGDSNISQISGQVSYNGQPVQTGMISLEPTEGKTPPHGMPIKDGKFASAANADIKPGKYAVRITAPDLSRSNPNANVGPNDPVPPTVPLLPINWHVRSALTVDLKPGKNTVNFSGEKMSPPRAEVVGAE